jgi:hypothetical protein
MQATRPRYFSCCRESASTISCRSLEALGSFGQQFDVRLWHFSAVPVSGGKAAVPHKSRDGRGWTHIGHFALLSFCVAIEI